MNHIKVDIVDKNTKEVTFKTDNGALTIIKGKIRSYIGFYTPLEEKLAFRKYYAIMGS